MQRLGTLLDGIASESALGAQRERIVSGVFDDSRRVQPEGMFVAVPGNEADGRRYIADALERGASVIVGEAVQPTDAALVVNVDDARGALARLASRWYALDSRQIGAKLIGITGTNGKSTTAHMTREILRAAGMRCGMLGTVQYDLCRRSIVASLTTPGPLALASYVRECADNGAEAVVMEVSSHALDQRRVDGLRFAVAGFTNLTQDHLDYHGTMAEYAAAKARLFAQLDRDATAVVNRDDGFAERMLRDCPAQVVSYAIDREADVTATVTRDTIGGTVFRMRIDERDLVIENAIVGRHNVYNAIAAAALARAAGAPLEALRVGLAKVRNIPGRLQRVPGLQGFDVFVDYAHTPDALESVVGVLRPLTRGKLIVVFGCGGDRDRTKRPLMARAAAGGADVMIVTSDNPRSEDPQRIIDEIVAGFDAAARRRSVIEPDRRAAIYTALGGAAERDVLLIAGKGHEDYQIIGSQRRHFDDVEVVLQAAVELARTEEEPDFKP